MRGLISTPIRAGRHLAIWLVWQATGVSLVAPRGKRADPPPTD